MTWIPDDRGQREFLLSPELAAAMLKMAETVKARAEATAPVGNPASDPHPGEYRDSFHATVEVRKPIKGPERVVGVITNDAPHAAAVEYGYSGRHDSPGRHAHHTLSRALTERQ